jgi:hypothetical protein
MMKVSPDFLTAIFIESHLHVAVRKTNAFSREGGHNQDEALLLIGSKVYFLWYPELSK